MKWNLFKEELCNRAEWTVEIGMDDIREMEDGGGEIFVFEATTGDLSDNRMDVLMDALAKEWRGAPKTTISRVLLLIEEPLSKPVTMDEVGRICDRLDELGPEDGGIVATWGCARRKDEVTRVVCAMR